MLTAASRFALLTNGSHLSRATLQALIDAGHPPALILLPQYPPAQTLATGEFAVSGNQGKTPLLQLAGNIACAYAPPAKQQNIIPSLEKHRIELALVACWPYLIHAEVVDHLQGAILNLHPSKLPLFRGADPLAEQLESGHRPFAVSLHRLSKQFDRGDLVAQLEFEIAEKSPHRPTVEQACAQHGVELFVDLLHQPVASWPGWPQAD